MAGERPDAIVIGAGPAGLACAAMLGQRGLAVSLLEKAATVGSVWRRHYARLHLHTDRGHSGLPGLPMPRSFPRYPSRAQVVEYLESYAAHFRLQPRFGCTVRTVEREGGGWRVATGTDELHAPVVVVATGWADFPHRPTWPGLDDFAGPVLHSGDYRDPAPYAGRRVLVVGFGNSGAEIALDLAEAGVATTLSVRGPVRILPRELLGLPILSWAIAESWLPPGLADFLNAPAIRLAVGPLGGLGLPIAKKGALRMIREDRRVPLLDIGTLARIRDGTIRVRGDVARFDAGSATFADGRQEPFDALILATGFRSDLRTLLPGAHGVLDRHGVPLATGTLTAEPGLFFCGQIPSATGQLREIGIEARRIAKAATLPQPKS